MASEEAQEKSSTEILPKKWSHENLFSIRILERLCITLHIPKAVFFFNDFYIHSFSVSRDPSSFLRWLGFIHVSYSKAHPTQNRKKTFVHTDFHTLVRWFVNTMQLHGLVKTSHLGYFLVRVQGSWSVLPDDFLPL